MSTVTGTVKISTTVYKKQSTTSSKITVLKPGQTVRVYWFGHNSWFAKVGIYIGASYTPTIGYALYFVNGNVHISGSGVTAAIKAMGGKIGDSSTGYQNSSGTAVSKLSGSGKVKYAATVRAKASSAAAKVGTLKKGIVVTASNINANTGWCKIVSAIGNDTANKNSVVGGYCQYKTSSRLYIKFTNINVNDAATLKAVNNTKLIKSVSGGSSSNTTADSDAAADVADTTGIDLSQSSGSSSSTYIPEDIYEDDTDYEAFGTQYKDYTTPSTYLTSLRGIYGLPYQFSSIVDPKLQNTSGNNGIYGRFYAERILTKMPLLIMSPGVPKYMPDYSTESGTNLLEAALYKGVSTLGEFVSDLFEDDEGKDGKFYTFQHSWDAYFDCINPMLRSMAVYLNLDNKSIPTTSGNGKLGTIEWAKYQSSYLTEEAGIRSVGFYVDSETQISESFSNSTAESQFSSAINGVNDLSREVQFLMGGASGYQFNDLINHNFDDAYEQIQSFMDKYTQVLPGLLTSRLKNTMQTIKVGGQLVFPEIWNDSDAGRSYDITIKLRSPDGDNFSWYMNIAVPLIHLLGFVLPRQLGYNGIQSPFLVRAYYKGFFNVNMGIITSMNISRGEKCKWNLQGLPLDVDVSFTIKDLYQSLSMADSDDIVQLSKNVDELDYLANLCGINVNKPDVMRQIELNINNWANLGLDILTFDRGFLGASNYIDNVKANLFNSLLR